MANSGVVTLGISDLNLIYASIKTAFDKPPSKLIHSSNYKNYRKDNFCADLMKKLRALDFANRTNPNTKWDERKTILLALLMITLHLE